VVWHGQADGDKPSTPVVTSYPDAFTRSASLATVGNSKSPGVVTAVIAFPALPD